MRKLILKNILLLIGSALTGMLLLALCFLIPVSEQNLNESNQLFEDEGWHPFAAGQYFGSGPVPDELDNWSDFIIINTAASEVENNIFSHAMNMPNPLVPEGYSYYWHGYVSIWRPLLYFLNYREIRLLNNILQLILVCVLAAQIGSMKDIRYAAIGATSAALVMPMALGVCLHYSSVFYLGTGSCLILLRRQKYFAERERFLLAFTGIGIITSFFDLLTAPLFTWGFPLIWWIALNPKPKKQLEWVKDTIFSGISWIVGYGGMWFLKWVLGSLILHKNIIQQAIDQVFLRSNSATSRFLSSRWDSVAINWRHYSYSVYAAILLAWILWFGIQGLRRGWKVYSRHAALMLVCAAPVVWYMVLSQHTDLHHYFTYRIFSLSILALMVILMGSLREGIPETRKARLRCLAANLIGAAAALCLAVPLSLLSRQELFIHNGASAVSEAVFPVGETLNIEFRPAFTEMIQLNFLLNTPGETGTLYIDLYEGENVVENLEIPLSYYYNSGSFAPIEVNWKLRKNRDYRISAALEGDSDGTFLITQPDQPKLSEVGDVVLGDRTLDGQPVMGFVYRRIPERNTLLYIIGTWATVCFVSLLPVISGKSIGRI